MKIVPLLTFFCVMLCSCRHDRPVLAFPLPIDEEQFTGRWVGFDNVDSNGYFLCLNHEHSGVFVSEKGGGTFKIAQVNRWYLEGEKVNALINMEGVDVRLCFELRAQGLLATLEGKKWQRRIDFRRERDVRRTLELIDSKAEQLRDCD